MDGRTLLEAAGLALLATVNVGLWTLRVALAAAGRRVAASLLAGVDALLFAVAFGAVLTGLDDPLRVGAYAVGVAAGTLLGLVANGRLSPGQSLVSVVVDGDGAAAAAAMHDRGWPVTATGARGVRGAVAVLSVAVHDDVLSRIRADLDDVAPDGFVLVEPLRAVDPGPLPSGMHVGTR